LDVDVDLIVDGAVDVSATFVAHADRTISIDFVSIATLVRGKSIDQRHRHRGVAVNA